MAPASGHSCTTPLLEPQGLQSLSHCRNYTIDKSGVQLGTGVETVVSTTLSRLASAHLHRGGNGLVVVGGCYSGKRASLDSFM